MIVPTFWAEARLLHRGAGKQVTVRRFGWSDTSEDEAQRLADSRAREALQRIVRGEALDPREPKVPYNGASGVPIREEIVARHGESVVTRNSYGARCLNTPNVLFADVDYSVRPDRVLIARVILAMLGATVLVAAATRSFGAFVVGAVLALAIGHATAMAIQRALLAAAGGSEGVARRRIERFVAMHPAWNLRIYQTPAGLRIVATHAAFDPLQSEVRAFFESLHVDPVYATMCRNQRCFRARLSAKPWRIGIPVHMRPRPGVWPVAPRRRGLREAWVAEYEEKARPFAACRFDGELGSGVTHPAVREVIALHDELSGAGSDRPIA